MAKNKGLSTGMSERASDIILAAICAVVLVIVAYPLYYVLAASFSDPYEVYAGKTFLFPSGFTLDGYKAVFAEKNIVSDFLNSVKYTVIGNRTAGGSGAILLYRGIENYKGEFVRTLDACHNQYGKMWACPDFFPLDGKQILMTSLQDMNPVGLEFHAGNGTLCLIGEYDPEKGFTRQNAQAIDYGLDFYAPQTLETPDGRRIMIAWMQNWDTVNAKPYHCRWFGQMTLPRELSLKNGRLIQNPVRELEAYRGARVVHQNIPVCGEINLPGVRGRVLDMTVTVRPTGAERYRWFRIRVAKDGEHETIIRYRPDEGTLKLDRIRSGLPRNIVHTRSFLVRYQEGEIKLRIILDRYSLEVFVNDGEQAASAVIYTRQEADAITFETGGSVLMDVEKYDLLSGTVTQSDSSPAET